jgi:hypothetical protein
LIADVVGWRPNIALGRALAPVFEDFNNAPPLPSARSMGNPLGENAFGGLIPRAKATACKIRNYNLKKFKKAQQTPRPPAPEPGRPPDGLPPIPPEIPDPDPAPPPVENPGDMPVPPITDPDVVEPGEPNPGHIPTRVFDEPQRLDESAGLTLALAGSRMKIATYSQIQS